MVYRVGSIGIQSRGECLGRGVQCWEFGGAGEGVAGAETTTNGPSEWGQTSDRSWTIRVGWHGWETCSE
jgi:hypothetical protein